jgi:hypothetical protein
LVGALRSVDKVVENKLINLKTQLYKEIREMYAFNGGNKLQAKRRINARTITSI